MSSKAYFPMLVSFFALVLVSAILWDVSAPGRGTSLLSVSAAGEENGLDREVFPKDKVVDVKITIDEADFQEMLDNASAEEMHMASVEYNGIKLDNIGIRTKGNLSLRSVVSSDSDRYSFKLSFDEYISSQTLQGISKINLNNNYSDATYMREFLTYELAEEMGLPTPKYSYVNVYVNGELWGFYLAIEQVGDAYLERNFSNVYGALYKAEFGGGFGGGGNGAGAGGRSSGGGDLVWQGDDLDSYPSLVQKSKKSNGGVLIDMLDELNNGTDYERVLDVNNALQYIALNAVLVNMDSYLGSNQQNYYLYEDDGVFSVLPWDYNMSFGGMGGGMGGGSEQIMIDEPTQGALAERPLAAKLLAVDAYKEKYHEIIREMVEGYLSDEAFASRVSELQEMISPYVQSDPRPFYSYSQYESAIPELLSFTQSRVANVAGQLDGTIASSGDGSGSGGGMGGGRGGFGGFGGMQGQDRVQRPQDEGASGQGSEQGARQPQIPEGQANRQVSRSGGEEAASQGGIVLAADTSGAATNRNGDGQQVPPNGQEGQAPGGRGGQPPNGQTVPGQTSQSQNDEGMNGQGQNGFGGPGEGGGFPGGQGGFDRGPGGFGGMPGMGAGTASNTQAAGSYEAAATTGIALVVLLLAGLFIGMYKHKRL